MRHLLVIVLFVVAPVLPVLADGEWDEQVPAKQPTAEERNTVNSASDASFDKRLPPVLPGERMNDSGRNVRVWSTAGPVPVSKAPEPWNDKKVVGGQGSSVSVIVDRRKGRDYPPHQMPRHQAHF